MQYCQKVLNELKPHFSSLKEVTLNEIPEDELEDELMGYSQIDAIESEWTYDKNLRMIPVRPSEIIIRSKDCKGNEMNYDKLLATLTHEIAHCLAPYVQSKIKKKWREDNHTIYFYTTYLKVARKCYELGFWKNKSMLTINNLKRLDQMNTIDNYVLVNSITK